MDKKLKKILSTVLCLVMLLHEGAFLIPAMAVDSADDSNGGTAQQTTTDKVVQDGITYNITRTVQYIGDRTYTVSVNFSTSVTDQESAYYRTSAQNGYITVEKTGWYILELWGGAGGDGDDEDLLNITPDGEGGRGGYVYGKVYLKKGQTLAYTIGTKGDQSLEHDDGGGGANGDGGEHGSVGSFLVGGGGGFSALYLFEEGEFDSSWITPYSVNIPTAARTSRYIMIAGGGGGGGAACNVSIINGSVLNAPDGGDAGRVTQGHDVALLGSAYDVEGYVFSGANGKSSGTSNDYVGIGGSNVPGEDPSTWLGLYDETTQPNDWTGTYNPNQSYGAGGSGNLRGGAGGAGFCGGSGGIMAGLLTATHVGGGGGGSSFIAKEVNGKDIKFNFSSNDPDRIYLSSGGSQPVGNDIGGAFVITYAGSSETDQLDLTAFQDVTFTGEISKYFTVGDVTSTSNVEATVNETDAGTTVTVSKLSIVPRLNQVASATATVTMRIKAKDAFAGGNGVPMVQNLTVSLPDPNRTAVPVTVMARADESLDSVNVPISMKAQANHYSSDEPGKAYAASSLYTDAFASVRDDLSTDWRYDYLAAIGEYTVTLYGDTTLLADTVAPTVTSYYTVGYTINLKDANIVTVGPLQAQEQFISAVAAIAVIEPGRATLNGLAVTVTKGLSYQNGTYDFALNTKQYTTPQVLPDVTESFTTVGDGSYTVPETGWYYIQAWGGNGGDGAEAAIRYEREKWVWGGSETLYLEDAYGGDGGAGANINSYVWLEAGTELNFTVGQQGVDGTFRYTDYNSDNDANMNRVATSAPGTGGTATSVSIGDVKLIIAGGGGGGGGAVVAGRMPKSTSSFSMVNRRTGLTDSSIPVISDTVPSSSNGTNGGRGSGSWSSSSSLLASFTGSSGAAGVVGTSYKNPAYGEIQQGHTVSVAAKAIGNALGGVRSGTNGQVSITLIETPGMEAERLKLNTMEFKVAFSRYFDIGDVTMSTTYSSGASFAKEISTAADGMSNVVTITDCSYEPSFNLTDGGTGIYSVEYYSTVTFDFELTPKDGFLGGNDVPVLAYGMVGLGADTTADALPDMGIRVIQESASYNPEETPEMDYANVAINYDLLSVFTTQNVTIHLGDSVNNSQLYAFTPPSYTGDDAWKDDFVTFVYPADETYSPTVTTTYPLTVGIEPTVQSPTATIVVPQTGHSATLNATVYVEMPITYDLTNLSHDGSDWAMYGREYSFVLTPQRGYLLPDAISLSNAGGAVEGFTYDPATGVVTIPAALMVEPLTVSAVAKIQTYSIFYVYEVDGVTDTLTYEQTEIAAGETIDYSWFDSIQPTIPARVGYDYLWTFEVSGGQQPETMPAHDMYVYGAYARHKYNLTVHYLYSNGDEAAPTQQLQVAYEDRYSVVSPVIDGYLADQPVVSGTQGAEDITVTVTYEAAENVLLVLYLKANGEELGRDTYTVLTNESYSYAVKDFAGYTPDMTTVEGVMSTSTKTVHVIYTPNTYDLGFVYAYGAGGYAPLPEADFSSATMNGVANRKVEYDQIYGYNPETGEYVGLPTPQIAGYRFAGWYLEPELLTQVTEADVYRQTQGTTLYAKWEAEEFKLTIQYEFLYTDGDFLPAPYTTADSIREVLVTYSQKYSYGEAFSVTSTVFEGYTPYTRFGLVDEAKALTVSGTMPAQNLLVVVTYEINTYTVTFKDAPGQHITYSDIATVDAAVPGADQYDTTWATVLVKHNVAPVYAGTTPVQSTREAYTYDFTGWISGEDGTVYATLSPDLPAAVGDIAYYTMFNATENIIALTKNSATTYYTNVAEALAYAEGGTSGTVTLKFRRNAGNPTSLILDDDRLILGQTYDSATTTALSVVIDVNGLTIGTQNGQTLIENTIHPYISVVINDSATTPGKLYTYGSGDVTVIHSTGGNLTVNKAVQIEAKSENGDATAISMTAGNSATYFYPYAAALITASAPNGTATALKLGGNGSYTTMVNTTYAIRIYAEGSTAIGIDCDNGAVSLSGGTVEAVGTVQAYGIRHPNSLTLKTLNVSSDGTAVGVLANKSLSVSSGTWTVSGSDALGVQVESGATVTVSGSSYSLTVNGTSSAIGVDIASGGTLSATYGNVTADAASGYAYGIRNQGSITAMGMKLNVTASGNAYGLYNLGGSVTASGVSSQFEVNATSAAGQGIGVISDGGSIGAAGDTQDTYVSYGVIYGSTYGIYSADDSIYVAGNDLFFKGSDESNAMVGTVVFPGYQKTEANAPYEGYYRLAMARTITFVTNGGTAIAPITQLYDTALPEIVTTMLGYEFASWYEDEELTLAYTLPARMPDADMTLYADWTIIEYLYTMDTELYPMILEFYGPTSGSDALITSVTLDPAGTDIPDDLKDMTYQSGTDLYIHTGWYTSQTPTSETYVDLSGDVSAYDTDGDCVIKLYSGWALRNYCMELSSYDKYARLGTDSSSPAILSVTSSHSSSRYAYMYYVAPKDGSYKLKYINRASGTSSSYRKYVSLFTYSQGTLTTHYTSSAAKASTTMNYNTTSAYTLKAGDVLIFRIERRNSSSYTSQIYGYIEPQSLDLSDVATYNVSSPVIQKNFVYKVTDGVVALPVPGTSVNPGYRFAGWSVGAASDDSANWLYQLSPDLIESTAQWSSGKVLDLYSNWLVKTWDAYSAADRSFGSFTGTDAVTVRDDATVSLRFVSDGTTADPIYFTFKNGLPAGTQLTLVDRSNTVPVYYSHTVGATPVTQLQPSDFVNMDDGTAFSGYATDVILQICYANAQAAPQSEQVKLFTASSVAEADASYALLNTEAAEETLEEDTVTYLESGSVDVTVPSLENQGFDASHKVYLRISWGVLAMSAGVHFSADGNGAVLYGSQYALIDLNKTVGDYQQSGAVTVDYSFPTMMHNEFADQTFTYEIVVVPVGAVDENVLFGANIQPVAVARQNITVTQTPGITVDADEVTAAQGDTLVVGPFGYTLQTGIQDPSIYIFDGADGFLEVTDACLNLFADATVATDGLITEDPLLTDGSFTAAISQDAVPGIYYLKFVYGDKYLYVTVTVQ